MSGYEAGPDAAAMARYLGHHQKEALIEQKLHALGLGINEAGSQPRVDLRKLGGNVLASWGYSKRVLIPGGIYLIW